MYKLGCSWLLVIAPFLWPIPYSAAQCPPPRPKDLTLLSEEDRLKPQFPDGSTARFVCATGYVPAAGSGSITCTGRKWSDLTLECKKRPCGSPGEVTNGRFDLSLGTAFGSVITAICNEGFMIIGPRTMQCTANGWSGRVPVCEVVKCRAPPEIANGRIVTSLSDEFPNYNDVIQYSCNMDFTLVGASQIVCSKNGVYDPPAPKCIKVSCPTPDVPNGVRIQGAPPPYGYKSFVVYECEDGFKMFGEARLTCEINGWSSAIPICYTGPPPAPPPGPPPGPAPGPDPGPKPSRAQCPPPRPKDLTLLSEEDRLKPQFPDGSTARFVCATGYVPAAGSGSVTCTGRKWSDLTLECKKRPCGSPGEVTNGRFDLSLGTAFGSVITAICNEGFMIIGPRTMQCTANGWSGRVPVCEVVKCRAPPEIANGRIVTSLSDEFPNYNDVIQYSCNMDFTLVGASQIVCSKNGVYDPPAPKCIKVSCPTPDVPNGVRIQGAPPPYGYKSFVVYECEDGFKMFGEARLTCEINGWSSAIPICYTGPPPAPPPGPPPGPAPGPDPGPKPSRGTGYIIGCVFAGIIVILFTVCVGWDCYVNYWIVFEQRRGSSHNQSRLALGVDIDYKEAIMSCIFYPSTKSNCVPHLNV